MCVYLFNICVSVYLHIAEYPYIPYKKTTSYIPYIYKYV